MTHAVTADQPAIDLSNVEKVYRGGVYALRSVSMRVGRGEVFGLLGPNGAGKSTLVKIMMTVVKPSRCNGTLLGEPVGHKPTLARVGYLPENHRFPRYLTGRQTLDFLGALSKTSRPMRRNRIDELLEIVGMQSWADRRVGLYSKGMMQRIGLAQALVHDPDLVLLDEPTDGVDPMGRKEIRDVLFQMKRRGKTIFINSHLLSELEMVCDRVAILVGGQVATSGTLDELALARQYYAIELGETPGDTLLQAIRSEMPHLKAKVREKTLQLNTIEAADVQPVIDLLRSHRQTIRRVTPIRPSLEDLFVEAVGGGGGKSVEVGARSKGAA